MQPIRRNSTRQSGFTLMELLIVISVLGLLLGMLIPRLGGVTDDTVDTVCDSNNKGLRYYVQNYYHQTGTMPNNMTNMVDPDVDTAAITANNGLGVEGLPLYENPEDNNAEVIATEFYTRNHPGLYELTAAEVTELNDMGITHVLDFNGATRAMERNELADGDNVMMMGIDGGDTPVLSFAVGATPDAVGNPFWLGRIMLSLNDECSIVTEGMIQASALCPGGVLSSDNFTHHDYFIILPRLQATVDALSTAITTLTADETITFVDSSDTTNGREITFDFSAQEPWNFDMSCPEGHKWPDNDEDSWVSEAGDGLDT